jgi:hypothetical protein
MVGRSTDAIGDGIESLQQRYGSFPVNQTTLSLCPDAYRDTVDRAEEGIADVYVRVHNDDGEVLQVEADGRQRVPRCVGTSERPLRERARRAVEQTTGVTCTVDEIVRVTIAGVRNAQDADAETVYRLLVLFDATYEGGTVRNGSWQADADVPEFV